MTTQESETYSLSLKNNMGFCTPKKGDLKQPAPLKFHIFTEEGVCEEDPTSTSLL